MRTIISTSEIVAEINTWEGLAEMHANAEGTFDVDQSLVTGTLECDLRPSIPGPATPQPELLPARQVVREHVSVDEATLFARDVFHHWVERVRRADPVGFVHSDLPPV
ncbi:hypothetical protein ACXR0O_07970 [Verrucomicrobiota bacterium sgz303538]